MQVFLVLASLAGLEPATHSLEGCCSIQLSYRPVFAGLIIPEPASGGNKRAAFQPPWFMERVMGIEPTQSAWKAEVLPLNYTREFCLPADFTARHLLCPVSFDI